MVYAIIIELIMEDLECQIINSSRESFEKEKRNIQRSTCLSSYAPLTHHHSNGSDRLFLRHRGVSIIGDEVEYMSFDLGASLNG
jgi:hypothetical protein